MSEFTPASLDLVLRYKGHGVVADTRTESSVASSVFEGEVKPGALQRFSPELEGVLFKTECWNKLKVEHILGKWTLDLKLMPNDSNLMVVEECTVDVMAFKIDKEGKKIMTLTVGHSLLKQSPTLEAAVSLAVHVVLNRNTEVMPGIDRNGSDEA